MRYLISILTAIFLLAACQTSQKESTDPSQLKRYKLKGTVMAVDPANKSASIAHQEIPGYMSEMTMDFPIKDAFVFEELKVNSEIKAELVVDNVNGKYWLEGIVITSARLPGQPPLPAKPDVAVTGKRVADFKLTNQDKKIISAEDFRGKVWALTFIYSECPLPNFCIAMSRNFSDLANRIASDDQLKENIRLLTVSFDPKRDTPEKLKRYGLGYLGKNSGAGDFKIWQLAVGSNEETKRLADFFGLRYEIDAQDKTQFSHSLRTAVISPDGIVRRVFTGSDWTPEELLSELKKDQAR